MQIAVVAYTSTGEKRVFDKDPDPMAEWISNALLKKGDIVALKAFEMDPRPEFYRSQVKVVMQELHDMLDAHN